MDTKKKELQCVTCGPEDMRQQLDLAKTTNEL